MTKRLRVPGTLTMLALLGLGGCAGSQGSVRGQPMSAEEHREEAAKLAARAKAEAQTGEAPPPNTSVNPNGDPQGYYSAVNKSPAVEAPARAERLSRHAQQHLAIAAGLDAFEEDACHGIPPAERRACPLLGPVTAIEDIAGGIRAHFAPKAPVDEIAADIRCHLAYARARGFEQVASCPLYVRGVALNRNGGPGTIDLVSSDGKVSGEIRKRAREEAVVVRER